MLERSDPIEELHRHIRLDLSKFDQIDLLKTPADRLADLGIEKDVGIGIESSKSMSSKVPQVDDIDQRCDLWEIPHLDLVGLPTGKGQIQICTSPEDDSMIVSAILVN